MSARTRRRYVKNSHWVPIALAVLSAEAAETYRLDSTNTQVSFTVQHLGIQWVTARFSDISGEFVLDPTGPGSRVDVTVGVSSLQCNEPRWNERLRSPEWLDVQRYPHMVYHSTSLELSGQRAIANGELTLHGMTRPFVLNVSLQGCPSAASCRFSARGRIRRSEYGLPHGFWAGGDQVDIAISGTIGGAVSETLSGGAIGGTPSGGAISGTLRCGVIRGTLRGGAIRGTFRDAGTWE